MQNLTTPSRVRRLEDKVRRLAVEIADLREIAKFERMSSYRAYLGAILVDIENCMDMLEEVLDEGS